MAKIYYGTGVQPATRGDMDMMALLQSLPPIAGHWYFVDPLNGSDGGSGESVAEMLKSVRSAYLRCGDGTGDGICVMSRGTGTAAHTTSYLTQELTWAKSGITVFGVCAPVRISPRARIANKTIVSTVDMTAVADTSLTRDTGSFITDGWEVGMKFITNVNATPLVATAVTATVITISTGTLTVGAHTSVTSVNVNLISLTGTNNRFYNLQFWNGGSNAVEIGGVRVTGIRNYFYGCHIIGGAGTAGATTYSLWMNGGEENLFERCTIGTNTFDRGDNACAEILISGVSNRNRWSGCEIIFRVGSGTAAAAVKSDTTDSLCNPVFDTCIFNSINSVTTPAAAHLVATSASKVMLYNCVAYNITAWGVGTVAHGAASAASAGGGLATAT